MPFTLRTYKDFWGMSCLLSKQGRTQASKQDVWEQEVKELWKKDRGAATTAIYRTQVEYLRRYAASILYNEERAEEIVHEVILRLMREERVSDPNFKIRGWLTVTTRNRCLNTLRDTNRRSHHDTSLFQEHDSYEPPNQLDRLEGLDRERMMRCAVDTLQPHYRDVVEERFYQDRSYQETAQALDIELGTVMSRLNRAKRKLGLALLAAEEP